MACLAPWATFATRELQEVFIFPRGGGPQREKEGEAMGKRHPSRSRFVDDAKIPGRERDQGQAGDDRRQAALAPLFFPEVDFGLVEL